MSRFGITEREPGKQILIGFVALPILFLISWWFAYIGAHAAIALVKVLGEAFQVIPFIVLAIAGIAVALVLVTIHLPATLIGSLTLGLVYAVLRFVPGSVAPIFLALTSAWLLGNLLIRLTLSMRRPGTIFWLLSYWRQQVYVGAYTLGYGCPLAAGSYLMYLFLAWLRAWVN